MEDLNRALVAQRGWELMANENSLWVKALAAKYCRGSTLLQARCIQGGSWFWQGLLKSRDIVEAGFCWSITSGREIINIWSSTWVTGLEGYIPKLKWGVTVDCHLNHVSDLIKPVTNAWKETLIRDIFKAKSAEAILNMSLQSTHTESMPRWVLSNKGSFFVKDAYLRDQHHRFVNTGDVSQQEWRLIWKLKVQRRLKLLFWKVVAKALPVGNNSSLAFKLCPLCNCAGETLKHLFLECSVSSGLWRIGPWPLDTEAFRDLPIHAWIKFLLNRTNLPGEVQERWPRMMIAVTLIVDTIWNTRNKIIHEGHLLEVRELLRSIQRRYQ